MICGCRGVGEASEAAEVAALLSCSVGIYKASVPSRGSLLLSPDSLYRVEHLGVLHSASSPTDHPVRLTLTKTLVQGALNPRNAPHSITSRNLLLSVSKHARTRCTVF